MVAADGELCVMDQSSEQRDSLIRSLKERAKELNCLYQVEEHLKDYDADLETVFRGVLEVLGSLFHGGDGILVPAVRVFQGRVVGCQEDGRVHVDALEFAAVITALDDHAFQGAAVGPELQKGRGRAASRPSGVGYEG